MEKKQAKFQIQALLGIAITLIVTVIGVSYGLDILGDIKTDQTDNSYEQNATQDGIEALAKIPEKMPTLVTVIMAAVVIGVLVFYLGGRAK